MLCFFVTGLLLQIAEDYFGIQLDVTELPSEPSGEDEYNQYRFRLNFNNRDYLASQKYMNGSNLGLERKMMAATPLSSNTLLQLFPFGLIFRSDLKIISTGKQLKIMFPDKGLFGQALPGIAKMRRPKVDLTWDNVTIFYRKATVRGNNFLSLRYRCLACKKLCANSRC